MLAVLPSLLRFWWRSMCFLHCVELNIAVIVIAMLCANAAQHPPIAQMPQHFGKHQKPAEAKQQTQCHHCIHLVNQTSTKTTLSVCNVIFFSTCNSDIGNVSRFSSHACPIASQTTTSLPSHSLHSRIALMNVTFQPSQRNFWLLVATV